MSQRRKKPRHLVLAKRYLQLCENAKKKWQEADEVLEELIEENLVGSIFEIKGTEYVLQDNFAKGNTAFKTSVIKRFDLKERK